jgi:hypothetical protein
LGSVDVKRANPTINVHTYICTYICIYLHRYVCVFIHQHCRAVSMSILKSRHCFEDKCDTPILNWLLEICEAQPKDCTYQPPTHKKTEIIDSYSASKMPLSIVCCTTYNRIKVCTILQSIFNFQALLKHRANACSGSFAQILQFCGPRQNN